MLLRLVVLSLVVVLGSVRVYLRSSLLPVRGSLFGPSVVLCLCYAALLLRFLYGALDVGLGGIVVRSLRWVCWGLGAGRLPVLSSVLLGRVFVVLFSVGFLIFSVFFGAFTMAALLARPCFGPFLPLLFVFLVY
ncbi:hypothetical protein [Phyllobacterium sp. CL33Tsu]|uniref:hypothetical protein n=1 Tax=Phyllobacterium sp. CL33Tsu TaxID=1798191 RepID=UPI001587E73F|nr:hypothetical protein [Phyllobacterium sp. CL33Tsu]